jgi:hypothetical protein
MPIVRGIVKGIVTLPLLASCRDEVDVTGAGGVEVVEIPEGVEPSASGLIILRNQWVIEHGDDDYSVLELPEAWQTNSEHALLWQDKDGYWNQQNLEVDANNIVLRAEKVPRTELWLADVTSDTYGNYVPVDARIIDEREHFAAAKGVHINEELLADTSLLERRAIQLDDSYPYVSTSCPDVGEFLDNSFNAGISPDPDVPTRYTIDPPRLLTANNDRGRCNISFGRGESKHDDEVDIDIYFPEFLVRNVDLSQDVELSADDAESRAQQKSAKIDWAWPEVEASLALGDLEPVRVYALARLYSTVESKTGYSFLRDVLGSARLSSFSGVGPLPETTQFHFFDAFEDAQRTGFARRELKFDLSDSSAKVFVTKASGGPITSDRESDTFGAPIYHPPQDLMLLGTAILKEKTIRIPEVGGGGQVNFILDPAATRKPSDFSIFIVVSDEANPAFPSQILSIRAKKPAFVIPPYRMNRNQSRGSKISIFATVSYCKKPQALAPNRYCPYGYLSIDVDGE